MQKNLGGQKLREVAAQPVGKSHLASTFSRRKTLVEDELIPVAVEPTVEADAMFWEADPAWVDYTRSVVGKNLTAIPSDFHHLDFAELECKGKDLLYANQEWIHPQEKMNTACVPMPQLTSRQKEIAV